MITEADGIWQPADFIVHVTENGGDVPGSPRPGSTDDSNLALYEGSYSLAGRGPRLRDDDRRRL